MSYAILDNERRQPRYLMRSALDLSLVIPRIIV